MRQPLTVWDVLVLCATAIMMAVVASIMVGCSVPAAGRRVAAHAARDAATLHAATPSPTSARLVVSTMAIADYAGPPDVAVLPPEAPDADKLEELKDDVEELRNVSTGLDWLLGKAPWLRTVLGVLGSLTGVLAALYSGRYVLALRRAMGLVTGAIERKGSKQVKAEVEKTARGTWIESLIARWAARAEKDALPL